jgi:hypothetical protein
MRRDMVKLGSHKGKDGRYPRGVKSRYREEGDFGPSKMSMRQSHKDESWYGGNYPGAKWGPIRKFLQKHKGKDWDEVWSLMCEEADPRSFEGQQFRENVCHLVERNCQMIDGEVCDERGYKLGRWWTQFYVHPETHKLEWVGPRRKYRRQEPPQSVFEVDGNLYHWHDGIWYRVKFAPLRVDYYSSWPMYYCSQAIHGDQFLAEEFLRLDRTYNYAILEALKHKYGVDEKGNYRFCIKKESANHKEIAKVKKKYGFA